MMVIDGWAADRLCERLTASGTGRTYEAYKAGDRTGDVGYSETINPPKMYGWVCPVCGRGLSPWTSVCPCKKAVRNQPSAQSEPEHTMEEFMQGQDLGSPEDGSL